MNQPFVVKHKDLHDMFEIFDMSLQYENSI